MIVGIGHDICDSVRIKKILDKYGDRFTMRCFTAIERSKCDSRLKRAASYAKRFAAKEACSKALGTGIRKGVFWKNMEISNFPSGKPYLSLTGGANDILYSILPPNTKPILKLSISDDANLAYAMVIIEAVNLNEEKLYKN